MDLLFKTELISVNVRQCIGIRLTYHLQELKLQIELIELQNVGIKSFQELKHLIIK